MRLREFNELCLRVKDDGGRLVSMRLPSQELVELTHDFLAAHNVALPTGTVGLTLTSLPNPEAKGEPITLSVATGEGLYVVELPIGAER